VAARRDAVAGWRLALRYAVDGGVPRRSLKIAQVVGTILNLVNQGDLLLADPGAVNWAKCALTHGVPYLVSSGGGVSFRLSQSAACQAATVPR
jgi:hypothetical protein